MHTTFRRFVFDDRGQDLIEYALLAGLVGIVGIVAWANILTAMNTTYSAWDTNVQGLSATTPDPIVP
jgi:Flp pilus assembly pilin Flp